MGVVLTQADLLKPLIADRAFTQSDPTHDVDGGIRRARYGHYADGGCAAGLATWARAGIPTSIYLFMRPSRSGDPLDQQAEWIISDAKKFGVKSVMVDFEADREERNGVVVYDYGVPTADDLQTIVTAIDKAGLLVYGYWSSGVTPGRKISGLRGVLIANISQRIIGGSSAGNQILGQQYSWVGYDHSVWDDAESYTEIFGRPYTPVPVPPVIAPSPEVPEYMDNLAPLTTHRVADIHVGAILRQEPSLTAARYTTVPEDPNDPAAPTRAFGFLSAPIGAPDWYRIADGDAGVFVRRSDTTGIRTADMNVGQ